MSSTAFDPGLFRPAPKRAPIAQVVAAQARVETKLFMRHGEQQLLNLIIPVAILIAVAFFPLLDEPEPLTFGVPMTLAIAATSSGFTGQAIALAFDRRYGALKRVGASGVPPWAIISGKITAVVTMVVLQTVLLCVVGLALGWRPTPIGCLYALVVLLAGTAAFTALGLLMGGTLGSELVLAGANLVWVILAGCIGAAYYITGLDTAGWIDFLPSVALASGLTIAFNGSFPIIQLCILVAWAAAAGWCATRWFRFEA